MREALVRLLRQFNLKNKVGMHFVGFEKWILHIFEAPLLDNLPEDFLNSLYGLKMEFEKHNPRSVKLTILDTPSDPETFKKIKGRRHESICL